MTMSYDVKIQYRDSRLFSRMQILCYKSTQKEPDLNPTTKISLDLIDVVKRELLRERFNDK